MRKDKAGTYERLSKEDFNKIKSDESMSIEGQRMIIESFCKFNDIDIVKDYVDDGYSGSNFDRPAFKQMIEDIESGVINCVITKDFSRLGRELYQTGIYIEEYFNDNGVRYIAINDGYDSFRSDDSSISMKLTYNDYMLRDTSRKVKSSLTARRKKGLYIGSIAKYGYVKDPADHHHLIPDPEAAIIIKRIFKMALNNNSCYEIARQLTDEKVPIPIVYKKETRGMLVKENDGNGVWRQQTVRDFLKSEMYLGTMVQNTYEKVRYNSKKIRAVDKSEYIKVEETHEPIIDKDTFDKVQAILKTGKKFSKRSKKNYLFSGLLICKECGHKISILEKKNKGNNSHYTQCNQYSKKGKNGVCNIHRVNYNLLEEDLLSVIRDISCSFLKEYDNKSLTEEANIILQEEISELQNNINLISKEIAKYNNAIEQLYMDKTQNNIPLNVFENLLNTYNKKLIDATANKDNLENSKIELKSKIEKLDYDKCAEMVKKFISSKKPTRAMIVSLVDKIEIDNDKNIKLFFKFHELSSYVR